MSDVTVVPMVLRGRVITDDLVGSAARGDQTTFESPDPRRHVRDLMLSDPTALADAHALSTDEIVDYLVALGERLDPEHNEHLQARTRAVLRRRPDNASDRRRDVPRAADGVRARTSGGHA